MKLVTSLFCQSKFTSSARTNTHRKPTSGDNKCKCCELYLKLYSINLNIILQSLAITPPWAFHLHNSLQTSICNEVQNILPPLTDYLKVQVKSQMAHGMRAKVTFGTDQQDDSEVVYDGDTELNAKKRPKKSGEENAFHVGPPCLE